MDDQLCYATRINPNLEQWRAYGAEWLSTLRRNKAGAMAGLKIFLIDYIHSQQLETDPKKFLYAGYRAPCIYGVFFKAYTTRRSIQIAFRLLCRFIEYVLTQHFSVEDDFGNNIVSPAFRNPLPSLPDEVEGHRGPLQESDKRVLPYHYIKGLQQMVCPDGAKSFADWKLMQTLRDDDTREEGKLVGGSWFVVPFDLIQEDDPDCVCSLLRRWRSQRLSLRRHGGRHRIGQASGLVFMIANPCPPRRIAWRLRHRAPRVGGVIAQDAGIQIPNVPAPTASRVPLRQELVDLLAYSRISLRVAVGSGYF